VFEAHRLVYQSTLGLREIKKKRQTRGEGGVGPFGGDGHHPSRRRAPRSALTPRPAARTERLGWCYRLGGVNLSEISANYQPPGDKIGTDNSPQGSLRVYPRTLL